ncbi:MAG: DUF4097 family beta strand repeat-containing protein [Dehalococcoidia bacterium]
MQYLRRIERTFAAPQPVTLHVANRRGDLAVIGEDRTDIAFVAQIALDARDEPTGRARLDAVAIPVTVEGGKVSVGPPAYPERDEHERLIDDDIRAAGESFPFFSFRFGGAGIIAAARRIVNETDLRVDMELRVPRSCAVEAELRAGALRIGGVHAGVRAQSRSGGVEIHDIAGDVSLETRSGRAEVRAIRGSVTVDSRSGRAGVAGVEGDVELESRSGRAEVRDVGGRTRVRAHAASVRIEDARGAVEVATESGTVEFQGRVLQSISIDVKTGSVRLAVPADSRFYLDAESRVGSVRSDLPVGERERSTADAPTVRVRTETGSVRVVLL